MIHFGICIVSGIDFRSGVVSGGVARAREGIGDQEPGAMEVFLPPPPSPMGGGGGGVATSGKTQDTC